MEPRFPEFKEIGLEDKNILTGIMKAYKPSTSEWTFTNFFIWRSLYRFRWTLYNDLLLVICNQNDTDLYAMEPVGKGDRRRAAREVLEWLREEAGVASPRIEKADSRFIEEAGGLVGSVVEPVRDHFDYVYRREDLVRLEGSRYRSKRNHINKLMRTYSFHYEDMTEDHIGQCIELQERWCRLRRCQDDLNLLEEWGATSEVLLNFGNLDVRGGVIIVEGRVGAFTLGEMLNDNTVVVHIEKADPEVDGLYPIINQQFCEKAWQGVDYINREQDLGLPGLREAKMSYYPDHYAEKYRFTIEG